jgi:hypothetical protein
MTKKNKIYINNYKNNKIGGGDFVYDLDTNDSVTNKYLTYRNSLINYDDYININKYYENIDTYTLDNEDIIKDYTTDSYGNIIENPPIKTYRQILLDLMHAIPNIVIYSTRIKDRYEIEYTKNELEYTKTENKLNIFENSPIFNIKGKPNEHITLNVVNDYFDNYNKTIIDVSNNIMKFVLKHLNDNEYNQLLNTTVEDQFIKRVIDKNDDFNRQKNVLKFLTFNFSYNNNKYIGLTPSLIKFFNIYSRRFIYTTYKNLHISYFKTSIRKPINNSDKIASTDKNKIEIEIDLIDNTIKDLYKQLDKNEDDKSKNINIYIEILNEMRVDIKKELEKHLRVLLEVKQKIPEVKETIISDESIEIKEEVGEVENKSSLDTAIVEVSNNTKININDDFITTKKPNINAIVKKLRISIYDKYEEESKQFFSKRLYNEYPKKKKLLDLLKLKYEHFIEMSNMKTIEHMINKQDRHKIKKIIAEIVDIELNFGKNSNLYTFVNVLTDFLKY